MRWRLLGSFALIILIALGTVAVVARYTTQQEVETFLIHGGQVGLENLATNLEDYYAENGSWTGAEEVSNTGSGANTTGGIGSGRGQGGVRARGPLARMRLPRGTQRQGSMPTIMS